MQTNRLDAHRLTHTYGEGASAAPALADVSLTIGADGPEAVAIMGPSGSGKSTLLHVLAAYLILPFYFLTSGVYRNWPAVEEWDMIARLFMGVNAVGLWDELFFICTAYTLLLRHFRPWLANILQAGIFVSFLWELGYQSWGPLLTIPFALVQGAIFSWTKNLLYVVTVHLLFDAVVFLVIVHAHHQAALPIFPLVHGF